MIRSDQLNQFGAFDMPGHVMCLVDRREPVTVSVQNQCRHTYGRKDVTDIDLHVHPHDGYRGTGARRKPHICRSPLLVGVSVAVKRLEDSISPAQRMHPTSPFETNGSRECRRIREAGVGS